MHPDRARPHLQSRWRAFWSALRAGREARPPHAKALPQTDAMRKAADELVFANLIGLLFLPVMAHFAWLEHGVLGLAMLMVYLIARRWGSLLPYLAQFGVRADDRAGMQTGLLYFSNILGSAAGAILTGFVLTDYLTLVQIAVVLAIGGYGLCSHPDRDARCRALGTVEARGRCRWRAGHRRGRHSVIVGSGARKPAVQAYCRSCLQLTWWRIAAASSPSIPTVPCSATECMTDDSTRDCRTIETESFGPTH